MSSDKANASMTSDFHPRRKYYLIITDTPSQDESAGSSGVARHGPTRAWPGLDLVGNVC